MGIKKKEVVTIFSMSYASLIQLGDKADVNIMRDNLILLSYGITPTWQTGLSDKVTLLKDLKTDEEYMFDVSSAVELRNATRMSITDKLRTIILKAENTFPKGKARYRLFVVGTLDDFDVNNFYRISKRVWRSATSSLTAFGNKLTQQDLDDLNTEITAYDNQIEDVVVAIQNRDEATEDRIELANDIYTLITEVMDYGKDYWRDRDEAKYNDYVIYRRDNNVPAPVTVEKNIAVDTTDFFFNGDFTDTTDFELTLLSGQSASICRGATPTDSCGTPTTLLTQIGVPVVKQATELGATGAYIKATNPATNTAVSVVRIRKL